MTQYNKRTMSSQRESTAVVNFTASSYAKYDNVKIANLIDTLQAHNLPAPVFARETQNYFNYHAERKQNVIDVLRD